MTPALGGGNRLPVRGLQRLDETEDLLDGAAGRHRVPDHGADQAVGVDHEGRPYGRTVGRVRMNHAVSGGDRHGRIFCDRERHRHAEAFADRPHPGDMGEQTIDGERQQITAQRLEAVVGFREGDELAGADRTTVLRFFQDSSLVYEGCLSLSPLDYRQCTVMPLFGLADASH
jgi:hypothetical protein